MRGGLTLMQRLAAEGRNTLSASETVAGAASTTKPLGLMPLSRITAAGSSANTFTVPAGLTGQTKIVTLTAKASTGNAVIIPAGWSGVRAPIELRAVGETVRLIYDGAAWRSETPLFPGTCSTAVVDFAAVGEAGSVVTINSVAYTEGASGQWLRGSTAANSATALAAAINAVTTCPVGAVVSAEGNSVVLYGKIPGTAANVTVAKTSASAITVENCAGGTNARPGNGMTILRTVTAQDIKANEVTVVLPFAPAAFNVTYIDANGAVKTTDAVATVGTSPNRIIVTLSGSTDLVATDVVCLNVSI